MITQVKIFENVTKWSTVNIYFCQTQARVYHGCVDSSTQPGLQVIKLFHAALSLQREDRPDAIKGERGLVFQDTSPVSSDSDLTDILERDSDQSDQDT